MTIAQYKDQLAIMKKYNPRSVPKHLMFEKRLYQHKETVRKSSVLELRVYRCEEEQHTIEIQVLRGAVLSVRAFYQI